MTLYLLSNFSLDMVAEEQSIQKITKLTEEEFNKLRCGAEAVIRNPAFARLLNVPMCKKFIQMKTGDAALVVGTDGGKLNYHANSLPEGISLKYTKVEILGATV